METVELTFKVPKNKLHQVVSRMHILGCEPVENWPASTTELVPWQEAFPNINDTQRVGICLREMRTLADLTQRQLAGLTRISAKHLSEMENGKRPISREQAKIFAKILKTDYRMFWGKC
jgi:DNA-binding XRE family transcriptional regulator